MNDPFNKILDDTVKKLMANNDELMLPSYLRPGDLSWGEFEKKYPHAIDRVAAGALSTLEVGLMPVDVFNKISERHDEIQALREKRHESRALVLRDPVRRVVWKRGPVEVRSHRSGSMSRGVVYAISVAKTKNQPGSVHPVTTAHRFTRKEILDAVRTIERVAERVGETNIHYCAETVVGLHRYRVWSTHYETLPIAREAARKVEARRRNRERASRTRLPDGALVGIRAWRLHGDILISPQRGTLWEGPVLEAPVWPDVSDVRDAPGIHAHHLGDWERLSQESSWYDGDVAFGRVRGYGRYALGTEGWRAERVVVDRIYVASGQITASQRKKLERRYACEVRTSRRVSRRGHDPFVGYPPPSQLYTQFYFSTGGNWGFYQSPPNGGI